MWILPRSISLHVRPNLATVGVPKETERDDDNANKAQYNYCPANFAVAHKPDGPLSKFCRSYSVVQKDCNKSIG